jgi:hypothetical protein
MLLHELLPLVGKTTEVVEVGDGALGELLRVPDDIPHRRFENDQSLPEGTTVVAFLGPKPDTQVDAEAIAPALRALPVGGRVVLLLGWPIEELPYHLLLSPLVDAECQVLQVVPLDKAHRYGAYGAVLAARVAQLAPARGYLDESPIELPGEEPGLRTLLRLAAEHVFGDIVARPTRRALGEIRDKTAEQAQRIRDLERELRTRDQLLEAAEERLASARDDIERLLASAPYRVGSTLVQGAGKPARALVSVPAGLVRVWRHRGNRRSGPTG